MVKWYSKKPRWRGLRHGKRGVQRRILLRFHIGGEREREREGVRERDMLDIIILSNEADVALLTTH
jgi:hypothetical protein